MLFGLREQKSFREKRYLNTDQNKDVTCLQ